MGKGVQKAILKKPVAAKLLQKGRCNREEVKRATTMTREKWEKFQVGMDAEWPLPAHMQGQKGHTNFKDETFSEVTRWTAETQIQYRPHAKAPGSKSHLRYERYSRAKTVGQSFALGSYPVDWCWDYERGFIRVLGGVKREEPVDLMKMEKEDITPVDMVVHKWARREIASKLGVSPKSLEVDSAFNESTMMRGLRLLAQQEAKQRLEAADKEGRFISDEDVEATLRRWAFARNPYRTNVMREGQTWVLSDTLGLLRDRMGDTHLTVATRRYPQVTELLSRWLVERLPEEAKDFKFTSLNLNCNYAAVQHRDQGNFGPSMIKAFGSFTGGRLRYWGEDMGEKLQELKKNRQPVALDLKKGLCLFNGNSAHEVESFKGECRYSVVFFTSGSYLEAKEDTLQKLRDLGMPVPAKGESPHKLLCPPRTKKKDRSLPDHRFFVSEVIRPRVLSEKARQLRLKVRVKPEDQKSFYKRKGSGKGADASSQGVKKRTATSR
jgi:hypothetical protein